MNFYSEWEARHRYDELLRNVDRRAGWNLERGLLPGEESRSLSAMVRRIFGSPAAEEVRTETAALGVVVTQDAPSTPAPTKRAS